MASFEKDDYTWKDGIRLTEFKSDNALHSRIFKRKVKDVLRYIGQKQQLTIPGLVVDNEIAITSCGLLCGK